MLKIISKYNYKILNNEKKLLQNQQRTYKYLKKPMPIWKPLSVERLYQIKQKKRLSKEDQDEFNKNEMNYRLKYRSIAKYLYKEFTVAEFLGGYNEVEIQNELIEQDKLIEENKKENQRMAELRKEYEKIEENQQMIKNIKLKLKKNELYEIKKNEAINKIIVELSRYPTYITEDKLTSAIEAALDNPTNYNYAIDLNGQIIFNKKLHPYALRPSSDPDDSNVTNDYIPKSQVVKLKKRRIYQ